MSIFMKKKKSSSFVDEDKEKLSFNRKMCLTGRMCVLEDIANNCIKMWWFKYGTQL